MNADTPLHELDRRERLRDLATRWNDAFLELCNTPPTDTQQFVRHIETLNAIEALEAEARRDVLP